MGFHLASLPHSPDMYKGWRVLDGRLEVKFTKIALKKSSLHFLWSPNSPGYGHGVVTIVVWFDERRLNWLTEHTVANKNLKAYLACVWGIWEELSWNAISCHSRNEFHKLYDSVWMPL